MESAMDLRDGDKMNAPHILVLGAYGLVGFGIAKRLSMQGLQSSQDYFEYATRPSYEQFITGEVTFLVIYSMAAGLFHIGEWLCEHDLPDVQKKYGQNITTHGTLWHGVIEKVMPDAGFIRDINNSAKHCVLTFNPKNNFGNPSTGMHHAANTEISMVTYGEGEFGGGLYGGGTEVKLDEDSRKVSLHPIAKELSEFWEALVDEIDPIPTMKVNPSVEPTANS